ncbi:MAG: bifunctional biotin--[acetyl-CoA-carboxylase] ligase/biotin operon repressor BirA [Pontibacterium sp.]
MVRSLLSILADGRFHSGQEIGERLGVSRSAVWKQIRKLETLGLDIYSVKGRGYRLPGGLCLLDAEQIQQQLTAQAVESIQFVDVSLSASSTNALAIDAFRNGANTGVFVAEMQTEGRGRRGRSWVTPFGGSLAFSLMWTFDQGIAALEGLSLLVGIAIARVLRRWGVADIGLKWPNDILVGGKKLSGVLIEMSGDATDVCNVVIGIGVNIDLAQSKTDAIDQPWVDLVSQLGGAVDRNKLFSELLNELVLALGRFAEVGFEPFKEEWQAMNAYADKAVSITTGNSSVAGRCLGVDGRGAIVLATPEGEASFVGGEVSLRLAE